MKTTGQPIHHSLAGTAEYPYTISFVIRKRLQYDSFLELPKEKVPPDDIWDEPEELEEWFDRVFERKEKAPQKAYFTIYDDDIEG